MNVVWVWSFDSLLKRLFGGEKAGEWRNSCLSCELLVYESGGKVDGFAMEMTTGTKSGYANENITSEELILHLVYSSE